MNEWFMMPEHAWAITLLWIGAGLAAMLIVLFGIVVIVKSFFKSVANGSLSPSGAGWFLWPFKWIGAIFGWLAAHIILVVSLIIVGFLIFWTNGCVNYNMKEKKAAVVVMGPTDCFYRMIVEDEKGKERVRSDYFRIRIKGDAFFEGFLPSDNLPSGPKCRFWQILATGEKGTWAGLGTSGKPVKGFFALRTSQYRASVTERIEGWFWESGSDPERDRPWTMTLLPTMMSVKQYPVD